MKGQFNEKVNLEKLSLHCRRDLGLLSSELFGASHIIIGKIFDILFSNTFSRVDNNQMTFYRVQEEYDNFSKIIAERFQTNVEFLKNCISKLISYTDWFYEQTAKIKTLEEFLQIKEQFFKDYPIFFAYHQAVYWGGDYLAKLPQDEKTREIVGKLHEAYKYNELVAPKVEELFRKLGIENLASEEVGKEISVPQDRSVLFIKEEKFILEKNEAKELEESIKKAALGDVKELKGISVFKGNYIGEVQLIINQNELDNCKPDKVLVTSMTRPQFNSSLKQAGAIVTNEGGMLCHAAILAREYEIPCVVGTKIATDVLKDGDLVEVDADKAVVRILETG